MSDDSTNILLKENALNLFPKQAFNRCKENQLGPEPAGPNTVLVLILFCCNKPSLVKNCISIPSISDHSIVLDDCDLKATGNKTTPRKVYQWSKADCQLVKEQTVIFANKFLALTQTRTVKENDKVFRE